LVDAGIVMSFRRTVKIKIESFIKKPFLQLQKTKVVYEAVVPKILKKLSKSWMEPFNCGLVCTEILFLNGL